MLNLLNFENSINNRYVFLSYSNINFLISESLILGTIACSDKNLNLDDWNWSKENKIHFLSKDIPYIPFDLIADLFSKDGSKFIEKEKSKIEHSSVETAIVLKDETLSLITSADFSLVNSLDCSFKELCGLPKIMFRKLGIENCCFLDGKMSILINPMNFLSVIGKIIQEK